MLQRNVSGGALLLPTLDPPMEVSAGAEIDHPDLLAGFIPVEDPPPSAAVKAAKPVEVDKAGPVVSGEGASK